MNTGNAIIEFLRTLIWGFVDKFKMKNPVIFGFVVTILLGVFNTLMNLLDQGVIVDSVLFTLPIVGKVTIVKALVFLLAMLGAHTPPPQPKIEIPITPHEEIDQA